jgi:UDP-N-acetyl-D-mannosaminuronic acid dehydrogenase
MPQSFPDRNVCIVGLGYVGLTLAVAMADNGFQIDGIEIRSDVLERLKRMKPHFFEPRLEDKLTRVMKRGVFRPASSIDPGTQSTVFIITVGTPLSADGLVQLQYIERASHEVATVLKDGDLVILRSTVKVGTARNIVKPILAATGKRFQIAVCPERTLEGQALLELNNLPQIIGADNSETSHRCAQLFGILTPTTVTVSSLEAAEVVKLIDNTYRDVSFGFANEVAALCSRLGVSASEVISAGKLGYPRTNVAMPGPVGGPCLEKDPHILAQSAQELGVEMRITKAARAINEFQPASSIELISAHVANMAAFSSQPKIALLGLAFKGVPATDDLRGTMALPILKELQARFSEANIVGYDAVVAPVDAARYFGIPIMAKLDDAVRGADIVVIANNHAGFRNMDLGAVSQMMRRPGIIYDFWNLYDDVREAMPLGLTYLSLGAEQIQHRVERVLQQKKTFLVTGGTGFIGSALVRRLIEDGHQVRVIDNDLRGQASRLKDLFGRYELVPCDVRDVEAVIKAARGCDSILHLAALNGTENFYSRPGVVLDVGIRGMFSVLEAAKSNNIHELVLVSSSEVYQTPPSVPTPEDVPLMIPDPWNPRYSYGGSKIISEIMLGSTDASIIRRRLIIRPHNVYGPDMGFEHVLPQFAIRAAKCASDSAEGSIRFKIQGDGSQTRAFIHIDDFIEGFMLVLSKGQDGNIYHIGTEDEISIGDVAKMVVACFGRDCEIVQDTLPTGGTLRRCPSTAKLRALGFSPKVNLQSGIEDLVRWYVSTDAATRKIASTAAA